jgi:type IV secretory pathway VirB2 component (pilin)
MIVRLQGVLYRFGHLLRGGMLAVYGLVMSGARVVAAIPSGGDAEASKGFFDWLTTSVTGFIAAGATVAIIIVLAVGLVTELRKEILVRIIGILIAIGLTPVAVEKATSGWSFGSK